MPLLHSLPGVRIVPGLLTDFDVIEENLREKDACVHIALGWGDLATSMLKNDTFPSVFLFETAARLGIRHFIYTSSTAAIGNLPGSVDESQRTAPSDFYGATKASNEVYLHAISHKFPMRCNTIRPGYTFGNPVIEGASIQPDGRFKYIVHQALTGETIDLVQYDGTQFLWAGDLAKVYVSVLDADINRATYLALGSEFTPWEKIAEKAIELTGSKSEIRLENRGYQKKPFLYIVDRIKKDFGHSFKSWDRIVEHLEYLIETDSWRSRH